MTHEIPCADTEHDEHPEDVGHADVVGTIDLPAGVTPTPEQLGGKRCEGCAVRRGLQAPRPAMPPEPEPDPPEPEPEPEPDEP